MQQRHSWFKCHPVRVAAYAIKKAGDSGPFCVRPSPYQLGFAASVFAASHLPLTSVSPALHLTAAWCFTVAGLLVAAGVAAGAAAKAMVLARPRARTAREERMFMKISCRLRGNTRCPTGEPRLPDGPSREAFSWMTFCPCCQPYCGSRAENAARHGVQGLRFAD